MFFQTALFVVFNKVCTSQVSLSGGIERERAGQCHGVSKVAPRGGWL